MGTMNNNVVLSFLLTAILENMILGRMFILLMEITN